MDKLRTFSLYLGVAFLITHELDAVMNHEWRVLPMTSWLSEELGYLAFLWAHVPLIALVVYLLCSPVEKVRDYTAIGLSSFLVIHAGLHWAFSRHEHYEFSSFSSDLLIFGGAILGAIYLFLALKPKHSRSS